MVQPQSKALPSIAQLGSTFKELLPVQVVEDLIGACDRRFYSRLYTPLIVLWCFIFQRLNADHTLDAVVSHIASGKVDDLDLREGPAVSARMRSQSTAAYSKARKRMPLEVLQGAAEHLAQAAEKIQEAATLWHGHLVALLDGTTIALWPEGDLAEHYGQASNQHGLAYWVLMRVVGAFSLRTAALLGATEGPRRESEQSLVKTVLAKLIRGSICIGDCNFGVFSVAQAARHYGLYSLLRLTKSRAKALAKRVLSANTDLPMLWSPSRHDQTDAQMSAEPIAGRLIAVRLEQDGFRPLDLFLFTTLLDQSRYLVAELVGLYGQRWQVELRLRDVKSTLDMGLLSAKSVAMARKDLWAGLAAYNIVRAYMALAAQEAGLSSLDLSFTHCWRRVQLIVCAVPEAAAELLYRWLRRLAGCRLQRRRARRIEPRATRRRTVQYAVLKGPREAARQRVREKLAAQPAKS